MLYDIQCNQYPILISGRHGYFHFLKGDVINAYYVCLRLCLFLLLGVFVLKVELNWRALIQNECYMGVRPIYY